MLILLVILYFYVLYMSEMICQIKETLIPIIISVNTLLLCNAMWSRGLLLPFVFATVLPLIKHWAKLLMPLQIAAWL
jgi:hypothetical protein